MNERGPEAGKVAPVEQKHSWGRQEVLKSWFKVVSLDSFFLLGHEGNVKDQGDLLISNLCKKVHCCSPHG